MKTQHELNALCFGHIKAPEVPLLDHSSEEMSESGESEVVSLVSWGLASGRTKMQTCIFWL